ncbi:MAG: Asp23/Gls24 family envelope stress response protein [Clostridiales Family XIII bacterium]|jgi:uncharacterized alkaline shock family protein YloU|nr:Asp23/Gls24 family envelope stress response protein [Clostridiales Family XIII bacterium]
MLYKEKTDRGKIKFGGNIVGCIARRVIADTDGRALAADSRGRIVKDRHGAGDEQVVDAHIEGGALHVKMYIVVRFGSSISKVTGDIDRAFREAVPAITGLDVGELSIFVKGLISKNVTKRNIEVTTYAGDTPAD